MRRQTRCHSHVSGGWRTSTGEDRLVEVTQHVGAEATVELE